MELAVHSAVELKRKAPSCHSFLEIIRVRWGKSAHCVFLGFAFCTNIIVTSMLLLGGSAVIAALTGMNIDLASFLIPLGIIVFTLHGGLKATFLADYIHTCIIYIVLCIFSYLIYATYPLLGSPSKVYDNLMKVSNVLPISGNKDGSILTFLSRGGLIFGVINIIGNFGTVFVDQSYWLSAIAAKPNESWKGYLLAGICLGCLALDLPVTSQEAGSGLVPPAVAYQMMGKGGAVLMTIMLFLAVTSAGSRELVAVSTLCSYDIYRTYIHPEATGKQIIRVSRMVIIVFGLTMGVFGIVLHHIGLNLNWVYLFMGIVIGAAVFPVAFVLTWKNVPAWGAIGGSITSVLLAVMTWLSVAKGLYGKVSVDSLGENYPMLAGNLVSICVSGIICSISAFISPQNFDWREMTQIQVVEKDEEVERMQTDKKLQENLRRARVWTYSLAFGFTILIIILWPVLAIPAGVFSKGYFTFWVILSLIWGTAATVTIILLPLWESRKVLLTILTLGKYRPAGKYKSSQTESSQDTDVKDVSDSESKVNSFRCYVRSKQARRLWKAVSCYSPVLSKDLFFE
ncbi:Urea-proton symporter DUR3 [Galdieria sulphuraria]|nr:Urea-proton symporter DUR3 [Galdieria sulphuraria]